MTRITRTCSFCVMDDSVAPLEFDAQGQCNCCRDALHRWPHEYFPNSDGELRLDALIQLLKAQGRGRPYDCMIGLSGGIDSAYLAHVMRTRYNLRVLAVHVDGGWNSEAAVHNIENLVRALDIDLYTYVVEWQEMRDLQLAFLRANVINQDIPQDHAFFATLYRVASERGIKTFLSGVNFATEGVGQPNFGHPSIDGRHIRSIQQQFGRSQLTTYPILTIPRYLWQTRMRGLPVIKKPLNWLRYDKDSAKVELRKLYSWNEYGTKHSESRFTKFYQEIYLPRKTKFDKRRLHLSSLIVTQSLSREAAIAELATPIIDERQGRLEVKFIAKKLEISSDELWTLVDAPLVDHSCFTGDRWLLKTLAQSQTMGRAILSQVRHASKTR
jgi:N-acetyl sugar amidotransferase